MIDSLTSHLTLACQACRSSFMDAGGDAAGWAIMFMLCIIVPVLVAVSFFIYRIAKRQKKYADSQYDDPFLTNKNLK